MAVTTRNIIAFLICLALALPAVAQNENASKGMGGPRRQIALIIFAGLGGAILGLSTLSFYGRPQDKLSNIAVGFAIGVIGGTAYVTYKAAAQPREFYNSSLFENLQIENRQALMQPPPADLKLHYKWTF